MANTGRFQELSPTKLQEILDNAVPEKTKKATKFGMKIFKGEQKVKNEYAYLQQSK